MALRPKALLGLFPMARNLITKSKSERGYGQARWRPDATLLSLRPKSQSVRLGTACFFLMRCNGLRLETGLGAPVVTAIKRSNALLPIFSQNAAR